MESQSGGAQPEQVLSKERLHVEGMQLLRVSSEIHTALEHIAKTREREIRSLQEKVAQLQMKSVRAQQERPGSQETLGGTVGKSSSSVLLRVIERHRNEQETVDQLGLVLEAVKGKTKQNQKLEQLVLFEQKNVEKERRLNASLLEEFEKLGALNRQLAEQRAEAIKETEQVLLA